MKDRTYFLSCYGNGVIQDDEMLMVTTANLDRCHLTTEAYLRNRNRFQFIRWNRLTKLKYDTLERIKSLKQVLTRNKKGGAPCMPNNLRVKLNKGKSKGSGKVSKKKQ